MGRLDETERDRDRRRPGKGGDGRGGGGWAAGARGGRQVVLTAGRGAVGAVQFRPGEAVPRTGREQR